LVPPKDARKPNFSFVYGLKLKNLIFGQKFQIFGLFFCYTETSEMIIFNQVSCANYKVSYMISFFFPSIKENSKKLKTLKVCAVVLKKSCENWKKLCFLAIFSNFKAEARVVDLKFFLTRRTKICDDVSHLLSTQA
jgi:hypothetical protein